MIPAVNLTYPLVMENGTMQAIPNIFPFRNLIILPGILSFSLFSKYRLVVTRFREGNVSIKFWIK